MANQVVKIKLTNQLAKNHLTALEKNHLALTRALARFWLMVLLVEYLLVM